MIDKSHRGFSDLDYRTRGDHITQVALEYKAPATVPDVHYIKEEHAVWCDIMKRIKPVHEKYAWSGYLEAAKVADLPMDRIPQLSELNDKLSNHTGFHLSPVAGLVDSRTFLSELMHRRMLSTQYIRHYSVPDYTPEPDVVHEIIGHAVPFFTEEYCSLNYLFGAAADKVNDEMLFLVERLYWYTIEFGLIKERGDLKAFGAGLISSIGELEQINSVPLRPFCVQDIIATPYDTMHMQPALFCAESYSEMRDGIEAWVKEKILG